MLRKHTLNDFLVQLDISSTNNDHLLVCLTDWMLLLITNRKSHTGFRSVPTSMTLNDLERRNSPYFVFFFHRIRHIFRPIIYHSG